MSAAMRIRSALRAKRLLGVATLAVVGCSGGSRDSQAARTQGATGRAPTSGEMKDMPGMEMPGMAAGGDGTVRLSADQVRTFGVTFGTVERRTLESTVRATGVVTVDESRVVQVAPKVGGFVERLYVSVTGQPVRRGEPLLELYSPELLAAQEELLVARGLDRAVGESGVPGVPAASTEDLLGGARRRLRLLDVPETQIDDVLRTGRAHRTVTLSAPTSGVVLAKDVVQGQAVAPGRSLYTIADLSRVWVEAALREPDAAAVRVGSAADIELASAPGRPRKGRVAFVYPVLDSVSRTVRARVEVANSEGMLKPGMYASVRLTTPTRTTLTVPTTAVVRTGERAVVFVDMGGGELMPHEVTLGATTGELTEVLSGVDAGQRVVTSAQYLLESESNVAEVMRSMIGQGGATGAGAGGGTSDMPGMSMPADKGADVKATLRPGAAATPRR